MMTLQKHKKQCKKRRIARRISRHLKNQPTKIILISVAFLTFFVSLGAYAKSIEPKITSNHAMGEEFRPTIDLTTKVIDEYLKGTPMAGTGRIAAETADKYELPRYLIVAIAGHESGLGKLGYAVGRHNAWGLGIHLGWDWPTWEEAYDKMGYTLRHYYFDEGRTTPETIEDKWAPGIENSYGYEWSAGVNSYGKQLVELENKLGAINGE
jgi:hypothetical protein